MPYEDKARKPARKDGISVTIRVGHDLLHDLESLCARTGQSKTVAIERAISAYCSERKRKRDGL